MGEEQTKLTLSFVSVRVSRRLLCDLCAFNIFISITKMGVSNNIMAWGTRLHPSLSLSLFLNAKLNWKYFTFFLQYDGLYLCLSILEFNLLSTTLFIA